ncbi:MAG: hypothetical protein E7298_07695 [Lachnospiraceae bacterium]|nr:hypothetical protein [Lachnospiraceae bacterium]
MKVGNTSFFIGEGIPGGLREQQQPGTNTSKSSGLSINGSTFATQNDPIAAKREEARKKAMKIIGDAFANDRKIDEDLDARSEHIRKLKIVQGDARKAVNEIESGRAALRDTYGVETDSAEDKELKLLEKEFRAKQKGSDVFLSKEDAEEIAKIKARGLTEYQSRSMEMLDYEKPYLDAIYEAGQGIEEENLTIAAIKRELPKNTAMLKAQDKADAIEDAASKEIMGMLVDEAKEHIDEEAKEAEEKAKEKQEKEEELQEKIDAARERRKEEEELTEDIVESAQDLNVTTANINDAQKDIKDMMNKLALVEEDMKGATVDERS